MQHILEGYENIAKVLGDVGSSRYMLVCDASFPFLHLDDIPQPAVVFDRFTPNPLYEQVCEGVSIFNATQCDAIVAIGGGSAIDVAKCIKLFCRMTPAINYLQQECSDTGVPLIALPSTAGTGSESTRFAVIYYEGKKQSVTHQSIIPDYAVLEPRLLHSLPIYQKKSTMLDALCQCIESLWSVNSTQESTCYAKIGLRLILDHWHGYIEENNAEEASHIMKAANFGGRAINISQTTAPHAMSYKLTSLYGIPHGHAVALCLPEVWKYMLEHPEHCVDPRGIDHLESVFVLLDNLMLCGKEHSGLTMFQSLMTTLAMPKPQGVNVDADIDILVSSVNPVRLKNNPVSLDADAIRIIYKNILQ